MLPNFIGEHAKDV